MRPLLTVIIILTSLCSFSFAKDATDVDLKRSSVDVPWHEFKSIIEKMTRTIQKPIKDTVYPPVDYSIRSVKLSGKVVDRKTARFTAMVDVFITPSKKLKQNGWTVVPVGQDLSSNSSSAVLEGAFLNGKSVPIHNNSNMNEVLFSKAGIHKLELKYFCPLKSHEGNWEIKIDLPRAASAQLNFNIPNTKATIFVNGIKQNSSIKNKTTSLNTAISLDQQLTIKYSLISDGTEEQFDIMNMSPKVFATTSMLMTIKENRVRYQYKVNYQIWHEKRKRFLISLPDSLPIENVSGAGLAEWKIIKTKEGSVLEAKTSFAPERTYSLTLDFSKKLETVEAKIDVPVLQALKVNRENGFLAIQASETMEVFADSNVTNLVAISANELPYWLQNQKEVLMRYKYNRTPFKLSLNVLRHKDMPVIVAIADEALFTGLVTEEGYNLVKYRYFIRNNHKQYLSLKMPKDWILWSALIDGNAVLPASTEIEEEVLIPLKKMSRTEEGTGFVLELVYWHEANAFKGGGKLSFKTPVIDINCQKIIGELWMPAKYKYRNFKGTMKNVTNYNTRYLSAAQTHINSRKNYLPAQSNTFVMGKKGRSISLPVEIEIPKVGTSVKFTKELTIAGEKGEALFSYNKKRISFSGFWDFLKWLTLFIISFTVTLTVLNGERGKKMFRNIALACIIFIVILIMNLILNLNTPAPGITIMLGALFSLLSYFGSKSEEEVTA